MFYSVLCTIWPTSSLNVEDSSAVEGIGILL